MTPTITLPATTCYQLQQRIDASLSLSGHRVDYTLYTIRQSIRQGVLCFSVATLALEDGMLGGMGYFVDEGRAREIVTGVYKTPLIEVDNAVFGLWKRQMGVRA